MRRSWLEVSVAVVVLAAISVGCSRTEGGTRQAKSAAAEGKAGAKRNTPPFSRSDADMVVQVTAPGYQFVGIPPTVKGPKVFFEMKNESGLAHDLEVVRAPGATKMGRIEPFGPAETRTLAAELPPGNYIAWCQVKLIDTPHADLGMLREFKVE